MKYQFNFTISAGLPFSRNFYLTEADNSPLNITGATVTAHLAKHARAIFATDSTADLTYYNYIPFTCVIEDGENGIFSLNMTADQTILLEEGKYTYFALITDANGDPLEEVVSGIIFVDFAMNPALGQIGPQN
ncbi:hypothetical cyanophage protein [Synechococcus phage S-CRM01]|uniref:hypothetical cyanophage protein n=1 Tax=Synechococcus phage S-CRM01 TaxID=1026955 RepID=UPI000209E33D|nr:hypothetical cyanophage protein [Synechococcus phage S-CRM01]AEC52966.1 hypothetical cyanophage protein [Synechococcus phage S-CRM01]